MSTSNEPMRDVEKTRSRLESSASPVHPPSAVGRQILEDGGPQGRPVRHFSVFEPTVTPFAGRLGGNQAFVVDPNDESNQKLLREDPDAAAGMKLAQQFDLRQFRQLGLWKAAVTEGVGTFFLVYITVYANISPPVLPIPPSAQLGVFNNSAYLGPFTGGLSNFITLTLCVFTFGPISGGHVNPLITMSTFTARLCTLPRAVLYIAFQTLGATLAGFLVRASYGSREFKVGGCWMFTDVVPVGDAFAVEFVASAALVFLAFGVGLDPRQRRIIPPSLSPFLVGLTLGLLGWTTGYTRYGFGGASMNPARCFGAYVGSSFPGWHWYHWVADICACCFHGLVYYLVPPNYSPN